MLGLSKFKAIFWVGASILLPQVASAQLVPARDPLPVETQWVLHMQDLEQSWEVLQTRGTQAQQPVSTVKHKVPDDPTLRLKLASIQGEFKFELYPRVRDFIEIFVTRHAESLEAVLGMSAFYQPVIERSLQQLHMPANLRFLPIALSAMNVCAVSEHGNAGLWQLNYHAAIRYGLHCSAEVDERRDLHRSTHAALSYLGDLQKQYGDWLLAVTAYTNGPAGLNRARLRSGGKSDFASLYPHLPTAARDYVSAFVAACYVAHFASELELHPMEVLHPGNPDRIQLQERLGFESLSKVLKIPEEQLRGLNPVCRMEYIPGLNVPVQLCLPRGYGARFTELRDSIYAMQASIDKAKAAEKPAAVVNNVEADSPENDPGDPAEGAAVRPEDENKAPEWTAPAGTVPIKYTIRSGDNLGAIAQAHGITVSQIMSANKLRSHNIRAGDTLTLYVSKAKAGQATTPKPNGTIPQQLPSPERANAGAYEWYTVQPGDNLWAISKKYPGVTDKEIMELNGISEKIQPGMKLKIPKKK